MWISEIMLQQTRVETVKVVLAQLDGEMAHDRSASI